MRRPCCFVVELRRFSKTRGRSPPSPRHSHTEWRRHGRRALPLLHCFDDGSFGKSVHMFSFSLQVLLVNSWWWWSSSLKQLWWLCSQLPLIRFCLPLTSHVTTFNLRDLSSLLIWPAKWNYYWNEKTRLLIERLLLRVQKFLLSQD